MAKLPCGKVTGNPFYNKRHNSHEPQYFCLHKRLRPTIDNLITVAYILVSPVLELGFGNVLSFTDRTDTHNMDVVNNWPSVLSVGTGNWPSVTFLVPHEVMSSD